MHRWRTWSARRRRIFSSDYRSMIIALSGGVGGAKLALGLSRIMPAEDLLVVVNTGDDFEHLGMSISPDIDTVAYTLAGLANRELGWGRHDETWSFMETMEALGGETWFRLGDRDMALHVERTRRLKRGESLSSVTADLCRRMGVGPRVLPMTDDPVRTRLLTDQGWLDFQEYFVHRRCEPVVSELQFQGAGAARAHPHFLAALGHASLEAVVICPSNPFISVEPILAIPGVREAMIACKAPIIAVSPIIAGRAVKGPTAKMMTELGLDPTAGTVAQRYNELLDGYVIDNADMSEVVSIDARVTLAQTLMTTLEDREALARIVMDAAAVLRRRELRGLRHRAPR
jgi:LPPG:FO 2-phospho-L-lactate transferase